MSDLNFCDEYSYDIDFVDACPDCLDPKYRHVAIEETTTANSISEFQLPESILAMPLYHKSDLPHPSLCASKDSMSNRGDDGGDLKHEQHRQNFPVLPCGVGKAHIHINREAHKDLVAEVGLLLSTMPDCDFSYRPSEFMWLGKHLEGPSCVQVEVRLYQSPAISSDCILSVVKIQSNASVGITRSFSREVFSRLRSHFQPTTSKYTEALQDAADHPREGQLGSQQPQNYQSKPRPQPLVFSGLAESNSAVFNVTDRMFLNAAQPVFNMAHAAFLETRLEAARMLCDLSTKAPHFLELPVFQAGCVSALSALVQDQFDQVRQHAIMAAAAFAEIPSYQPLIITSKIMPTVFNLIDDCCPEANTAEHWDRLPCETAHLRRVAAQLLAMLCHSHALLVASELQRQLGVEPAELQQWAREAVPALLDSRMREYASRAAAFLQLGTTTTTSAVNIVHDDAHDSGTSASRADDAEVRRIGGGRSCNLAPA